MTKYDHVRNAGQTRPHDCHWPGCERQVPPAMWGCKAHWFRLPKVLRDRIWATYRAGQEETLTPSAAYLDAADAVQKWIAEKGNRPGNREAVDSGSGREAGEGKEKE